MRDWSGPGTCAVCTAGAPIYAVPQDTALTAYSSLRIRYQQDPLFSSVNKYMLFRDLDYGYFLLLADPGAFATVAIANRSGMVRIILKTVYYLTISNIPSPLHMHERIFRTCSNNDLV